MGILSEFSVTHTKHDFGLEGKTWNNIWGLISEFFSGMVSPSERLY
jgi:hypothetical protein